MTQFHQAKSVFLEAARLPQVELNAFLDEQCGDDADLRKHVESLMAIELGDTTMCQEAPRARHTAPILQPDDLVAGHRIIRKLGEGGMGTVYLAQDLELNCRVAFKVLHRAYDTPVFNEQFVKERQTLAMMQHPGIARVRQAGVTSEGLAWFTMDYIEGLPLTTYCERNTLDIQARLDLLIKVCEAVQYAHGKMVIHRDLNPNNILVTTDAHGQPRPQLIDFGISRLMNETDTGHLSGGNSFPKRSGTPPYMSPEQYTGQETQVEVRSDIYSLGVLLYKLIAGCEPFDRDDLLSQNAEAIGFRLQNESPQLPSDRFQGLIATEQAKNAAERHCTPRTLMNKLRDGLDWIAFKAVNPRRTDRYSSADLLAADLQRFSDQFPVHAMYTTKAFQAKLFLRRNWLTTATISFIGLLLLAGVTIAIYQAALIQDRLQESKATENLLRESFFNELQPNYLLDQPFATPEAKAQAMRRLIEKLDASPRIGQEAIARMRFSIGNVFSLLKLYPEAEMQLLLARNIYANLDGNYDIDLDKITLALGYIDVMTGQPLPSNPERTLPTNPTHSQEHIQSVLDQMRYSNSNRSKP